MDLEEYKKQEAKKAAKLRTSMHKMAMKLEEINLSEKEKEVLRKNLNQAILKLKKIQAQRLAYLKKVQLKHALPYLDKWKKRYGERTAENDKYWTDLDAGWERAGKYRAHAQTVFEEEGVPPEFADLAFTESMWDTTVRSNAGARGAFQIMADTGRRMGLRVNAELVDERLDPIESARASARNLMYVYKLVGKWEPPVKNEEERWQWALLSYNMSPNAVQTKYEAYDGNVGNYCNNEDTSKEQAHYPSKFFAVRDVIEKNYEDQVEQDPPLEFDRVPLRYIHQEPIIHVVANKDNITAIANAYTPSRMEIIAANTEADPDFNPAMIHPGDEIIIPERTTGKKHAIFFKEIVEILKEAGIEDPATTLAGLNPHFRGKVTNSTKTIPETNICLPPGLSDIFYEKFDEKVLGKTEAEARQVQRNAAMMEALDYI